jgi:hypothetical protein
MCVISLTGRRQCARNFGNHFGGKSKRRRNVFVFAFVSLSGSNAAIQLSTTSQVGCLEYLEATQKYYIPTINIVYLSTYDWPRLWPIVEPMRVH